jgi:hypothetical protein
MNKPNGYQIALYGATVAIFGIIASKIVEHELLQNSFIDVLTVVLLLVFGVLCWISGWSHGTKGK